MENAIDLPVAFIIDLIQNGLYFIVYSCVSGCFAAGRLLQLKKETFAWMEREEHSVKSLTNSISFSFDFGLPVAKWKL